MFMATFEEIAETWLIENQIDGPWLFSLAFLHIEDENGNFPEFAVATYVTMVGWKFEYFGPPTDGSDIAADAGYYTSAHFIQKGWGTK